MNKKQKFLEILKEWLDNFKYYLAMVGGLFCVGIYEGSPAATYIATGLFMAVVIVIVVDTYQKLK